MPLNTILYGPPGTGKTYATFRRCVEICDGPAKRTDREIRDRYRALEKESRVEFITFHQSYGYEEFVEGLRPDTGGGEADEEAGPGLRLVATDGVIKRIAKRARKVKVPHVLVIDEINRANVSKVMEELVTLLEDDKRKGRANQVRVRLPHSHRRFTLPANLHILGTMNTADRSIASLDTALRRRFDFEELPPDSGMLRDAAGKTGIDLPAVLRAMNERLEGILTTPRITLEILPKIDGEDGAVRAALVRMLAVARELPVADGGTDTCCCLDVATIDIGRPDRDRVAWILRAIVGSSGADKDFSRAA